MKFQYLEKVDKELIRRYIGFHNEADYNEGLDMFIQCVVTNDNFTRTDFTRAYLEQYWMHARGNLSKGLKRFEKRTVQTSNYSQMYKELMSRDTYYRMGETLKIVILPKYAPDYSRVILMYFEKTDGHVCNYKDMMTFFHASCEYLLQNDFSTGYKLLIDMRNLTVDQGRKFWGNMDIRRSLNVVLNPLGYVSNNFLTNPSDVYPLGLFTARSMPGYNKYQLLHESVATVQQLIPKSMLPEELGGTEESVSNMFDKWVRTISTEEHEAFLNYIETFGADLESERSKYLLYHYLYLVPQFEAGFDSSTGTVQAKEILIS